MIALGTTALILGIADSAGAAAPDGDGDGVPDTIDNCLVLANSGQADANGNARGDACECGDVSGDGRVDSLDAKRILLCVSTGSVCPSLCDVTGDAKCDLDDVRRILLYSVRAVGDDALVCKQSPAEAACVAQAPGLSRDDSRFAEPRPPRSLRAAAVRFRSGDPDASFGFHDCHVDSFATSPKPTIPDYAMPVLAALGIQLQPRVPERLASPTHDEKPAIDYDAPENRALRLPYPDEDATNEVGDETEPTDADADPGSSRVIEETRVIPNPDPGSRPLPFDPPSAAELQRDAAVAKPVLGVFLGRNAELFGLGRDPTTGLADLGSLRQLDYRQGPLFRRVTFEQSYGPTPILGGQLAVYFDLNWNVIGISRAIATPAKLSIDPTDTISPRLAVDIAVRELVVRTGRGPAEWSLAGVQKGVFPIRRRIGYDVSLVSKDSLADFTVRVAAANGAVLNVNDNVTAYTDARTRRWGYQDGGHLQMPAQVISNGVYTRKSNTLTHDHFFMENDNRGSDDATSCGLAPFTSETRPDAYGTTSGSSYIRHTHRNDRDFSIWAPSHHSFAETHTYWWSRNYFNWNKNSFTWLGALPDFSDDSKRLAIINNTCLDDVGKSNGTKINSHLGEGENNRKVVAREECRPELGCAESSYAASASSSFVTCDGEGCALSPSTIHHEINHFVMGTLLGIGSSIDCGDGVEGKLMHEGMLGSAMPQAYWHAYYGVGYAPPTSHLFTSSAVRGRVHADSGSRLTRGTYTCSYGSGGGQTPYEAGRVAGQALWEIYHGRIVTGDSVGTTPRPDSDTTFQNLAYWASDLAWNSEYQDLYEVANRVMQIASLYMDYPDQATRNEVLEEWCDIWQHHGLGTYIDDAYCID